MRFSCFFCIAVWGVSSVDRLRLIQAHGLFKATAPFKESGMSETAGYTTFGWVKPGTYPRPDNYSAWVNQLLPTSYSTPTIDKGTCFKENKANVYTESCYEPNIVSFWWGHPIKLTSTVSTITNKYFYTLSTPRIALTIQIHSSSAEPQEMFEKYSLPPYPWKIYSSLTSQFEITGVITEINTGFFWYKPLFWAINYTKRQVSLYKSKTVIKDSNVTYIYPVSRFKNAEGLFGFQPTTSPTYDYVPPSNFEFYPID
ncbi:hypothetical protein DSO57_1037289 [Entomophthora muscae]|uniref:Uncharacterized protein n=1 Tax=Entomophthora muscae TaxID=34485 RepID=A0ACC2SC12_9FUNG|nr:hypothetical protein DSO57_1037289 [Entomophthora muscae]